MLCRMPAVRLPDNLKQELHQSVSGQIDNTEGPGVAVYLSSDGNTRADIYIGFKLDGFRRYLNISSAAALPNIKMQFAVSPSIFCESHNVFFDPNKDELISVQVIGLLTKIIPFNAKILLTASELNGIV